MKPISRAATWTIVLAIAVPAAALTAWGLMTFVHDRHPADRLQLAVVSTSPDSAQPSALEIAQIEATFTNTTACPLTELALKVTALDDHGTAVCTRTCVLLTTDGPRVWPRRRTTLACEIDGIPVPWSGQVAMKDKWSLDAEYDYSARVR